MINKELFKQAESTINFLKSKSIKIATAESCTGGMVSSFITSVSGVSEVFELGITSYSCKIKNKILGVKAETLDTFGAISKETATEMAENIRKIAGSDIGVSVTGAAGPLGSEGHPAGYVFIAISGENGIVTKLLNIEPKSRNFVRETACLELFKLIRDYVGYKE